MSRLVTFPLRNGSYITVEVEEPALPTGPVRASRAPDTVQKASQTVEDALEQIKPAAQAIMETLRTLAPEDIGVEFGFKLSSEAGVIIAKCGGEAHFTVNLRWRRAAGYESTATPEPF